MQKIIITDVKRGLTQALIQRQSMILHSPQFDPLYNLPIEIQHVALN
jgi:hypothetical protein